MRIIKLAFISFIAIFIIILLISFLFPSHIRISRATNLPNNRNAVFALLQNERSWHPAYADSAAAHKMTALEKMNKQQTDSTYSYQLQSPGKKAVTTGWQLYGLPTADSLTLQWYMDFQVRWYPWEKFGTLFYETTYGAMMERGLANFKKALRN